MLLISNDSDIPNEIKAQLSALKPVYPSSIHTGSLISAIKIAIFEDTDCSLLVDNLISGDLVYGFAEPRTGLMDILARQGRNNEPITIDEYNNFGRVLLHLGISNYKSTPFTEKAKELHCFAMRFEGERNPGYGGGPSFGAIYAQLQGTSLDSFIKKRCKLGILWLMEEGKKLHILLDNCDFEECFDKSIQKYTYSEIRFIYRNWEYLETFYHDNKIIFYKTVDGKLNTVAPPWEGPEVKTLAERYKSTIKNSKGDLYSSYFLSLNIDPLCPVDMRFELSNKPGVGL